MQQQRGEQFTGDRPATRATRRAVRDLTGATGVSREVLDAVARALHLDGAEREHLLDLFDTPVPRTTSARPAKARLRATAQAVLDSMSGPAIVQNDRLDVIGANALGRALYSPLFERGDGVPNVARFAFLDFHVSLSQVGLLISAFAVGMVVGAPIGSVVTLVGLGGALATPPMTGLVLATAPEHQAAPRGSSR